MERYPNNRCFIVNHSKLEGRIDPHQFHFERVEAISKIKLNNDVIKLKKAVKNVKSTTNKIENTDIYIGLENIESDTGKYIETGEKNSISSAGVFKKGNILFPKLRPYLNKVHFANFDGICSTEFHIFEGSEDFLNEFLAIYLRSSLIVNQTKHLMTGNTLPRLQTEDINNLPIPKISIEKQRTIINFYNKKIDLKQQKETEAKLLLDSIDNYLLDELNIALPLQDNSIQNRIFNTNFSEITGSRIDPKLYDNNTKAIKNAIRDTKFPLHKLKNFIVQSVAGDWGKDVIVELGEKYQRCLVIRATEFDNNYNLNLENSRVKYRYIKRDKLEKIDIKENDLLIEKSGGSPDQPVGRISILTRNILSNNFICYSNFIHKIRVSDNINPEYLFCYLKTAHNIKLTDSMQSQTNGIRNLIMSNYYNQDIPFPPKEKQNEIAEKISAIRNQAKLLQEEAKQIFKEAQIQVEQMLIG